MEAKILTTVSTAPEHMLDGLELSTSVMINGKQFGRRDFMHLDQLAYAGYVERVMKAHQQDMIKAIREDLEGKDD